MPYYGSVRSPSLKKMDNSRMGYGRKRISLDNIIGDPFALATTSIAILAWIIAFISSIVAQVTQTTELKEKAPFQSFTWWAVVYMLFEVIGVTVVIAADAIQTYHVAIVGYVACGLVLTTSAVNSVIYSSIGARQAASAGFILLSVVNVLWIFYFGSAPSAVARAYIDSFALQKDSTMNRNTMAGGYGVRPQTSTSHQPPQMYTTSAQLNGFENPSPAFNNSRPANASPGFQPPVQQSAKPTDPEIAAPTEYPYRAKAIYSYEANPDDANEISFSKHEILEISDVSGRWWQARKENGDTGIAPSNYLILL
ncbi:high osmolarity signaling protein SHO1 [Microdochium trichocladiopsis]|uniref:High osmolarity signaling protein SHO1 n=1 Tax=Microdochium trichocladiopsis TaxID=1682393 RepID=A0A9P8YAU6_9PEZI|nr:high osmolarity signaling protein SHO1 [Microdochium trichocladiopsis]KAH7037261.1 high osmolarity signaling protein SHO1 [Microdochium trichocladiopsis]